MYVVGNGGSFRPLISAQAELCSRLNSRTRETLHWAGKKFHTYHLLILRPAARILKTNPFS